MYPFFSSRWQNAFGYGQIKTEFNVGKLPLRPYLTTRFVGDIRRQIRPRGANGELSNLPPQYLSESSFIFGFGLRTLVWKGVMAWGEAGQALRYLGRGAGTGLMTPDYRGGISGSRSFGRNLGASKSGWFTETANDFVFVSRFDRDFLLYSQNKAGYTFARAEESGFQLQSFMNWNLTADVKRYAWANFGEVGPGIRFRFNGLPPSMFFVLQGVRGKHFLDNPQGKYFNDLRAGFWYALLDSLVRRKMAGFRIWIRGCAAALFLALSALHASVPPTYHVLGDDPGPWPKILGLRRIPADRGGAAGVVVLPRGSDRAGERWRERVEQGLFLVLEGESAMAEALGFRPSPKRVVVQSLREERAPHLPVVWEKPLELPIWNIPREARTSPPNAGRVRRSSPA